MNSKQWTAKHWTLWILLIIGTSYQGDNKVPQQYQSNKGKFIDITI